MNSKADHIAFWQSTWNAWKSGALAHVSSDYEKAADKSFDTFLNERKEGKLFGVVLGRPAEEAEVIVHGLRQKAFVEIGGQ